MTVIPEFYTIFGRIGVCEVIGLFFIVTFGFDIHRQEVHHLLPLFVAPLIIGCAVLSTMVIMERPFHSSYFYVFFSYIRNILYLVIGLYCGRILAIKDLKKVLSFFIVISCISMFMAWGQISIDSFLNLTQRIYNPEDMHSVNWSWSSRPPGPFVRVFSYSYFTVIVFWLINSYPPRVLHPWLKHFLIAFVIASCFISQTKGALLALILSFFIWIFQHAQISYIKKYQLLFLPILLSPLIYFLTIWKDFSRYDFFNEFISLDWSTNKSIYDYFQMLKEFETRFQYMEMQWNNFLSNPFLGDMYQSMVIDKFQDNLYLAQLSTSGGIGLIVILSIFFSAKNLKNRYEKINFNDKGMALYNSVAQMVYWSVISAYLLGVTSNFFVGNRAINIVYFFWGLLEGTYSKLNTTNEVSKILAPKLAEQPQ